MAAEARNLLRCADYCPARDRFDTKVFQSQGWPWDNKDESRKIAAAVCRVEKSRYDICHHFSADRSDPKASSAASAFSSRFWPMVTSCSVPGVSRAQQGSANTRGKHDIRQTRDRQALRWPIRKIGEPDVP
jgi:hypothetical protein